MRKDIIPVVANGKTSGVRADGAHTLVIKLEGAVSYFEPLLASIQTAPAHPRLRDGVSNGPYYVVEASRTRIALVKNPYYRKNIVPEIFFEVNEPLGQSISKYQIGEIDITCPTYFPAEQLHVYAETKDLRSLASPIVYLLEGHPERFHNALNDFKMLCHLLPIDEIAHNLRGIVDRCTSLVPEAMMKACGTELMVASPRHAAAESGAVRHLLVLYADYYPNGVIVQYLKHAWEGAGLTVDITGLPFERFVEERDAGNYDICLSLLSPVFGHPMAYYLYYLSYLDEDTATRLEAQLNGLFRPMEVPNMQLADIEQTILESAPIFPMLSGRFAYLQNPNLVGYQIYFDGSVSYNNLRWATEDMRD